MTNDVYVVSLNSVYRTGIDPVINVQRLVSTRNPLKMTSNLNSTYLFILVGKKLVSWLVILYIALIYRNYLALDIKGDRFDISQII